MKNYLELLQDIIDSGSDTDQERTGVGTRKVFDRTLRFDLQKGFPILTTRKVALRIAFEELMWMLRGQTDANILKDKNIHIWSGNTTKEFQAQRGLSHLKEGDIGKGYGWQMRNYGAEADLLGSPIGGVDQLKEAYDSITSDPHGRRHIMSYWNPKQLHEAVLPPCHLYCQFVVIGQKLNLSWVQRSVDTPYGLPYNIMFYSLLLTFMARITGYELGEVVFHGIDVHVYKNQIAMVKEQLSRAPKVLPTVLLSEDIKTFENMLGMDYKDIVLVGYDPHPDIKNKPKMAV